MGLRLTEWHSIAINNKLRQIEQQQIPGIIWDTIFDLDNRNQYIYRIGLCSRPLATQYHSDFDKTQTNNFPFQNIGSFV